MEKKRIILDIVGLLSVFLLPWYITIPYLGVLLFVFGYYVEVITLFLVSDLIFMDFDSAYPFPFFGTIVAIIISFILLATRKYFFKYL